MRFYHRKCFSGCTVASIDIWIDLLLYSQKWPCNSILFEDDCIVARTVVRTTSKKQKSVILGQ